MMIMFADDRLVIGITKGNVDRLLEGKPASIIGPRAMNVRSIMVIYGVDKLDIQHQLEAAGVEFAQVMKDGIAEDPS